MRATSPKGGQRVSRPLSPFALPRAAPAAKKGGALSPPAPLSCGAPLRQARGGPARRSLASLFRGARGKSVVSRVCCGVSGKSHTTTARTPPSEREALCVSRSCHPSMSPPPLLKGGHPSDGICVTPRGGNRRLFHRHWMSWFLTPIHLGVCGEQDRGQYSRMAEDGPSPGGNRDGPAIGRGTVGTSEGVAKAPLVVGCHCGRCSVPQRQEN